MLRKKIVSIVLMLMFMFIFSTVALSEHHEEEGSFIFDRIGQVEGLKDLSVSSVIQDKNGFIWFATQGGLHKYNGSEMTVFRTDPFQTDGIVHNLIQTMYYDEDNHKLWLGTYQGVSCLDIATEHFENYTVEENGLSNNVVVAIAKDAGGSLWFGTLNGLNRLDEFTGQFETYPIEDDVVRSLELDSRGRMLVGTLDGL